MRDIAQTPTKFNSLALARAYVTEHPGRYLFPIKPAAKFPPLEKGNLSTNASNDLAQIAKWVEKFTDKKTGIGPNWGLALKKSGLFVADIDTNPKKGKQGQATYDELDLLYGWPDTETVDTPSGGFHKYYEGEHRFALGKYGLGLDIDSPNYVLIAGCTFDDGTSYKLRNPNTPTASKPGWFDEVIKAAKKDKIENASEAAIELDKPSQIAWVIDFLKNDADASIEGQGGENTTFRVACTVKDAGISYETAVELMTEHYNVEFVCEPLWERDDLAKKIRNAYEYGSLSQVGGKSAEAEFTGDDVEQVAETIETERQTKKQIREAMAAARAGEEPEAFPTLEEIKDDWVYLDQLMIFVCRKPEKNSDDIGDGNSRKRMSVSAFDKAFMYRAPKKGRLHTVTQLLLSSTKDTIRRRSTLAYKPGRGEFVGNAYNLYVPSPITPSLGETDEEKAQAQDFLQRWRDHLAYLLPDEAERRHLINWMAWLVQNLSLKPKHALLFQGENQGTGKTFVAYMLSKILGEHNVSSVKQKDLASQFNAYALNAKLLVIEELRALDKGEVKETLHDLITEEPITINDKNEKLIKISNCFGVFGMTNDEAAIRLEANERRYLVVRTEATPREARYYDELYAMLREPVAIAAIAHELMNWNVGDYSGQARAPVTKAKQDMTEAGADDVERWLLENAGMPPLNGSLTTVADIVAVMPRHLHRAGVDKRVINVLKRKFAGVCVGQIRVGNERPRIWAINGKVTCGQVNDEMTAVAKGRALRKLAAAYEAERRGSAPDQAESDFGFDEAPPLAPDDALAEYDPAA